MNSVKKFIIFSLSYKVVYQEWTDIGGHHSGCIPEFILKIDWNCGWNYILKLWNDKIMPSSSLNDRIINLWILLDPENQAKLEAYVENDFKP